jgi:hydrogenase maturation protease
MPADVHTLIIGCGNLLRGDDAAGPLLIRRLWELGLPPGVRCADGGTGGMDVAFQMRGVANVLLVDAAHTGSQPGTIFEVPGVALETLPPLTGLNMHSFRWDHALAFGRWLLKDEYPKNITVYLIEAQNLDFGSDISNPVRAAIEKLSAKLLEECTASVALEV